MATDGKYATLAQVKQYIIGTRTDPANPTVFNQQVSNTPDDALISDCLLQSESAFEMDTGCGFDQQSYTMVTPVSGIIDQYGWAWLWARERGPVTAVSAVSYMNVFSGDAVWRPLTWDATGSPPNGIILPPTGLSEGHPWPESWRVRINPNNATLLGRGTSDIFFAWSYTAGFPTIPQSLQTLIMEMASYVYRLREVPVGRAINMPLGTVLVPSDFPPHLRRQMKRWAATYN